VEAPDRLREHPSAHIEPLLSIAEVRQVLRISESGVYRLMRSGELPAVRIGGRTLFSPDTVRTLIAARSEPPGQSYAPMEEK
jgi:excisionase family DNA binding protein